MSYGYGLLGKAVWQRSDLVVMHMRVCHKGHTWDTTVKRCPICSKLWRDSEHRKEYKRLWRLNNPDKIKAYLDKQAKNPSRNRASTRKHRYGITDDEYKERIAQQDNKCAICELRTPISVDHCHVTNRIRGILCRQCNTGIGQLNDSPDLLRKAIKYLET